jgi:RNA polymerase sigma-70 factor, ECF subfamily
MPTGEPPTEIDDLYRKYGPMVRRRARAILGEESAAQDALQEVFVSVVRSWGAFRREASPVTWLYRTTTNHCLNRLRDERRRVELEEAAFGHREEKATVPLDDRATLAALLRSVPDELREIAVYYYVDEMSQDEIADLLKVARRTIGNRLEAFRIAARAAAEPQRDPGGAA